MLRDMRGGGSADGSPNKFRLMQLALNAVALLAITGALFAYFKANPAVQVILNSNISKWTFFSGKGFEAMFRSSNCLKLLDNNYKGLFTVIT